MLEQDHQAEQKPKQKALEYNSQANVMMEEYLEVGAPMRDEEETEQEEKKGLVSHRYVALGFYVI